MGTQLPPPPLKGHGPQFSAHVGCGQTAGWTKMPLGVEVGLGPGDFVSDGDPAPPEKKWHRPSSNFRCVYVVAGWIKAALGTEVNLDPGDVVLDGVPAHLGVVPLKGAHLPVCGPCLLWPNGWMDEDATWYGGRTQPRRLCFRWGPSPLPKKVRSPQFSATSIVAKRLHGSTCHLVRR